MIAKPRSNSDDQNDRNNWWKVLIDSDTFPVSQSALSGESLSASLPERLRFTVAHELAHTLSFRAEEFGISLPDHRKRKESSDDFVGRLESETNALAPLLLVSDRALEEALFTQKTGITLGALSQYRKGWGVSRSVMISRLNLLRTVDSRSLKFHAALQQVVLGLGTWQNSKSAQLSVWPIFSNFGNDLLPEFVLQLQSKASRKLEELVSLPELVVQPDGTLFGRMRTHVGTHANPSIEQATVDIYVEDVARQAGSTFLFFVKPSSATKTPTR